MKHHFAPVLFLATLLLLPIAAFADSREQVQLRLPRCAPLTEARQFLDCYYAAVQPLRADLGLERASQTANFEALFALATPAPQHVDLAAPAAATRLLVVMRVMRCDALKDTRQYVDCYYGAVQPLRAVLGLAAAPQAATYASLLNAVSAPSPQPVIAAPNRPNLVPQAAYQTASLTPTRPRTPGTATNLPVLGSLIGISTRRVPEAQFGFPNAPAARNGIDHISSRVSNLVFNPSNSRFTVTLENGQVWRQIAADERRAEWKQGQSLVANIAYGASGSFNLSMGDKRLYKVVRVR